MLQALQPEALALDVLVQLLLALLVFPLEQPGFIDRLVCVLCVVVLVEFGIQVGSAAGTGGQSVRGISLTKRRADVTAGNADGRIKGRISFQVEDRPVLQQRLKVRRSVVACADVAMVVAS